MPEERLDRIEEKIDGLTSRFDGLTSRFDGLTSRVDGLDVKVDGLTSRVDALDVKVDGLNTKIDKQISRVEGLDTRVHKLTIMHEDMRDDVKRIADGVAGAGGRFDRLERSVDEIKSAVNSFIQTQSVINGDLSGRGADHEQRITALEKRPS